MMALGRYLVFGYLDPEGEVCVGLLAVVDEKVQLFFAVPCEGVSEIPALAVLTAVS